MKKAFSCDGASTRQHNEPAGNQDVWQYHVHITPRYGNDDFYFTIRNGELMPEDERAKYADLLKKQVQQLI